MTALPLIKRQRLDAPIAWLDGEMITAGRFLAHAEILAEALPENVHVINLCEDYYYFLLGYAAALLRGNTTLLPPNRAHDTIENLCHEQRNNLLLCDRPQDYPGVDSVDCRIPLPEFSIETVPAIAANQSCAILYTSGSSGEATPHRKSWKMMVDGARLCSERLALPIGTTLSATVPPQHMFGLEIAVMLPLQYECAIDNRRPLFPADISSTLESLPEPRALITTPLQLRACARVQQPLPACNFILSATAPLAPALAQQIETLCTTTVKEIYGSTETGGIATRATASETSWLPLPDVTLQEQADGWWLHSPYLPAPHLLADQLQRDGERFLLLGRNSDLIKIAGKRVSLGELNHILLDIDGVKDGQFFLPDDHDSDSTTRLAAVVVSTTLDEVTLGEKLRQRIDTAFMPRPLLLIDQLPRNEVGKLPRHELMTLIAQH
jgi:acyl-coenzyme A synthetase/AMP-(fatty) acid ligase